MSQRMQQGQPMIILGEDSQRTQGKDAQTMNITAGKAVAEAVRTTLGPKGMDKMLVDSGGSVVVTNDGVTILKEMDIDHPAANMIVEVSETQEDEVGDGTTTAVVIAGELLDEAEELIDQDIHPTRLAQGYRRAAEKAKEILEENSIDVSAEDRETLVKIAATAMTGKGAESAKDQLADLLVDAVLAVRDDDGVDTDNVSIEKVVRLLSELEVPVSDELEAFVERQRALTEGSIYDETLDDPTRTTLQTLCDRARDTIVRTHAGGGTSE